MTKNYTVNTENNLPILYFDGGSRGNPGEAAGAGVIVMPNGQKHIVSKYIKFATNNEAEYTGLIIGLQQAENLGIQELTVKGDSQLVINQITGKWKVNSPHLKEFYNEAKQLTKKFEKITLSWVRRNENHLADLAVNQCIDKGETQKKIHQVESKLQDKVKKNPSNLKVKTPYAKGDVIVIAPANNSQLKQQGVIINDPQLSEDGTWTITINLDEN